MRVDHIAVGVASAEACLAQLCDGFGLRRGRVGTRVGTDRVIAFAHDDATGLKIEVLETDPSERGLLHLAFAVDDVGAAHDDAVAGGCRSVSAPFRLDVAKADTAVVAPPGLDWLVQVIAYDPDAPEAP
jgi:catechol 2,3-dioxygenase-like lactoylglutathione lyase family enzyme